MTTVSPNAGSRGAMWVAYSVALLTLSSATARGAEFVDIAIVQQNMIEINENQLVSWVFNNHTTLDSARSGAENRLQARVELAELACTLSPQQRTRITLAGQGDIHRFLNKFAALRRSSKVGKMTQQEYQELWQKLQPLAQEYSRGLHSDESLFARSLETTLNHEQYRQYEDFERARNRRHYVGMVKGAIAIVENEIPLTAEQRQQLFDAIVAQDPPRSSILNSQYKFYVVLYRISKLPTEKIRPIFLENEWEVMTGILRQAQSMEQFFEQQGIAIDE